MPLPERGIFMPKHAHSSPFEAVLGYANYLVRRGKRGEKGLKVGKGG